MTTHHNANGPVSVKRAAISKPQSRKARLGRWIIRQLERIEFAVAKKRSLHGVVVAVVPSSDKGVQEKIFVKVDQALKLIGEIFPVRCAQIRRHFRAIVVSGPPGLRVYNGRWEQYRGVCLLAFDYMISVEATPSDVAGTIIHEFTHARLFLHGFGYEEEMRKRVDRACCKAVIRFARRLPDGQSIIESATYFMNCDSAIWNDSARLQREADAFLKIGCPKWFVLGIKRIGDRQIARHRKKILPRDEP